ncbi:MAG: ankyrin repeat domain-containing protein [Elusimicrobiota bacterium]
MVRFLPIVLLSLCAGCSSALIKAAAHGDTAQVRLLLDQGANVNVRRREAILLYDPVTGMWGGTPLNAAASQGHLDTVKLLLERGANVRLVNKPFGRPPLVAAAFGGDAEIVRLLLEKGAGVDQPSQMGERALYSAVRHAHPEAARVLLDYGADPEGSYVWTSQHGIAGMTDRGTLLDMAKDEKRIGVSKARARATQAELVRLLEEALRLGPEGRRERAAKHYADVELERSLPDIEAAEKAGDAAVQAGKPQEALSRYAAAIRACPPGTEKELRLREKVIRFALGMAPPPAVPEQASYRSDRAMAFMKRASDAAGYEPAVDEMVEALLIAPWWAASYFNLGLLLEKTGDYAGAIRSLRLYLLADPAAQDAEAVKKKIVDIEVQAELAEGRQEP